MIRVAEESKFSNKVTSTLHVCYRYIVLIALQNSGKIRYAARQLRRLGARTYRLGLGQSYALVGYNKRGRKPRWVKEVTKPRNGGPSIIKVKIPLKPQSRSKY